MKTNKYNNVLRESDFSGPEEYRMLNFTSAVARVNGLTMREFMEQESDQVMAQLDKAIMDMLKHHIESNLENMCPEDRVIAESALQNLPKYGNLLSEAKRLSEIGKQEGGVDPQKL